MRRESRKNWLAQSSSNRKGKVGSIALLSCRIHVTLDMFLMWRARVSRVQYSFWRSPHLATYSPRPLAPPMAMPAIAFQNRLLSIENQSKEEKSLQGRFSVIQRSKKMPDIYATGLRQCKSMLHPSSHQERQAKAIRVQKEYKYPRLSAPILCTLSEEGLSMLKVELGDLGFQEILLLLLRANILTASAKHSRGTPEVKWKIDQANTVRDEIYHLWKLLENGASTTSLINDQTYHRMIGILCASSLFWKRGLDVFDKMTARGIKPPFAVIEDIFRTCPSENIDDAIEVFEQLDVLNVNKTNSLHYYYFRLLNQQGLYLKVLEVNDTRVDHIDSKGHERLLNCVVHANVQLGQANRAMDAVDEFVSRHGVDRIDLVVFNQVMNGCSKSMDLELADTILLRIRQLGLKPDSFTISPYIKIILESHGSLAAVERLENFPMAAFDTDPSPFNIILHQCTLDEDHELARRVLNVMHDSHVQYDSYTVREIIELFGDASLIAEVYDVREDSLLPLNTNVDQVLCQHQERKDIGIPKPHGAKMRPFLDLHEMSLAEARIATLRMLDSVGGTHHEYPGESKKSGGNGLLIITGTGKSGKLRKSIMNLLDDLNVLYKFDAQVNSGRVFIPEHGLRQYNVERGNEALNNVLYRNTLVRYGTLFSVLFATAFVVPKVVNLIQ